MLHPLPEKSLVFATKKCLTTVDLCFTLLYINQQKEKLMTPKERAAIQQALEALENERCHVSANWDNIVKAITALREVLANTRSSIRSTSEYSEQAEQETMKECRHCGFLCKPNANESKKWYPLEQSEHASVALISPNKANIVGINARHANIGTTGWIPLYAAPVQQAEQKPVAYMFKVKRTLPSSTPLDVFAAIEYHPLPHEDIISKEPLYAAPVRTKDLTDDEIRAIQFNWERNEFYLDFARAVIAAYKEKNK